MINNKRVKSTRELRRFGLVMTCPLLIIGGLMIWRGRELGPYLICLAALFLLSGLLVPRLLAPVERIWMAFAQILSVVMTHVILTLAFFLVITPVGLLLRIMGKDLLKKKFRPEEPSYWVPVEPDGPCSRPNKPY